MAVEAESNDAVFFDSKLNEIRRIKGSTSPASDLPSIKLLARQSQSDFTTETEYLLWVSGPHRLTILNVLSLSQIELPHFWQTTEGTESTALVAIASHKFEKAAGIGSLAGDRTIQVWDASSQPITRGSIKASQIFKSRNMS